MQADGVLRRLVSRRFGGNTCRPKRSRHWLGAAAIEKGFEADMRNILVSSNCQTAGVALALKAMLPRVSVKAIPLAAPGEKRFDLLSEAVAATDMWVTSAKSDQTLALADRSRTIRIPQIEFDAFHPDIMYARKSDGTQANGPGNSAYHSYVALWSFRNGLSLDQCEAMFSATTFEGVGYFDRWDVCSKNLRALFASTDLRFDDFFRPMVQASPFMHSLNHPCGGAMVQLSRLIARKLGGNEAVISQPFERVLQDTLAIGTVWPVYPAIAARFGAEGGYVWKVGADTFFSTLRAYLEECYRRYEAEDARTWRAPRLANKDMHQAMTELAGTR